MDQVISTLLFSTPEAISAYGECVIDILLNDNIALLLPEQYKDFAETIKLMCYAEAIQ